VFAIAAESPSFAEAAERLGITRSAVGKAIARLEERLGVRLFHRSTRNHGLTDEGRYLLARCSRTLEELRATEAELTGRAAEPVGELRIDLPELLGRERIVPILLKLAERHPALSLTITFNNRRVELIEEGFDLTVRIGDLDDSSALASRLLGHQDTLLCASTAYLARTGEPGTVEDLAGHMLLPEFRGGRSQPWPLVVPEGGPIKFPTDSRLRLGHVSAVLAAVTAGAGIGLLPHWLIANALRDGSLQRILPSLGTPRMAVSALWPHSRMLASKQRVVIDALRAGLRMDDFAEPEERSSA